VEQTGAGAWRFEVRDTGPGFGPEMKARLFERFTQADGSLTRRHGGSGLGLAVAAELAGAMGGTLSADSKPGEGSTFVLELPLAPAAEEALSAPPAEPAPAEPRRARILLAEDNPTNRKVVEVMLSGLEVELVAAADGAEAVRAFESEAFDAVLMDMQMPEMDGLDATRAIRARERELGLPRTPVLMLSANAMPEHLEASRQAGADRHLAKPIRLADLLAAVSEALAGKSERLAA
jgi:CheY-like chemotaxis protein